MAQGVSQGRGTQYSERREEGGRRERGMDDQFSYNNQVCECKFKSCLMYSSPPPPPLHTHTHTYTHTHIHACAEQSNT